MDTPSPSAFPLWTHYRRATVAFAVAVAVVGALGLLSLVRLRATLAVGDEARQTVQALRTIEVVLGRLRDLEAGQRGYLLTGDEGYLEPYIAGRARLPRDLRRLRRLLGSDPDQAVRMLQLEPLVAQKVTELELSLARRRTQGADAAMAIVRTDFGKGTMDAMRVMLTDMAREERARLRDQVAERARDARSTATAGLLGSAMAVLLLVGSVLLLRRQVMERELAERATRESQQRLLVTLSSIGDAVIATDTAGRVTFMNPVARQLTGWSDVDAKGRPLIDVFDVVNETSRARVENPVDKVLREGRIVGLANHTVLVARDGHELPIDDSAAPIRDGDGEIMGVVLVFRDVSDRKAAEETRDRYEESRAANQAKDDFLAVLSHELRSPLNAMLGWVRLLQRPDRTTETIDRATEVLERNLGTQTRVINELLDVSRIVSGRLELALRPVRLTDIVRGALDSIRVAAEGRGLTLAASLPDDATPLVVRGDPDRLQQVLGNLLTNAVKFTPSGGRVDVTVSSDAADARIVVRDTGAGIAPAFLPHVFERFRQADSSASRAHGGLGLGLAIAHSLVERHGGTITAESEGTSRGAAFTVTLPLATDQVIASLPTGIGETAAAVGDLAILLVDDDLDTLEALRLALESRGAHVRTAENVGAALAAWDAARPDILVSDISMPGENGYDLIRAIRARDGVHTPAVAITGLVAKEDRAAALAAGFDEHLSKPIDPESLVRAIGALAAAGR
jgi:PAS domain S-box-containing protein